MAKYKYHPSPFTHPASDYPYGSCVMISYCIHTYCYMKQNFQNKIWSTVKYIQNAQFKGIWPYIFYIGVRYFFEFQ